MHKKTGLSKASRLLKCIAFVTLMAFTTTLFTPYSFAQSPYSKVPGGDSVSASVRQTLNGSIVIPPELGLIEESFHGTSGKTVLYIQDAHDSLEAQENIAKIINHLVTNDGVKTVFEEGYEGPVLTDKYFGFIKDPMIKEKVSYFLMDHLRVGGAEYAHINRTRGFNLLGADSIKLHKENVDQYRLSAEKKEAVTKDLKALEKELKSLVDGRFPRPLKEWLKTKRQFDTKKLDLFTYLGRTMLLLGRNGVEKGLGLIRFILEAIRSNDPVVIEKAKHIDAREVFGELTRLEQAVSETYLHDAADKQLFEYYKILSLLNRLNELQVSQEEYEAAKASLEAFDTDSFGRFIFSQTPKTLILSRMWERNIKDAVRFYEIAQERDHSLSQMLGGYSEGGNKNEELVHKPNVSVLVFGGFHKEAIKRILEAKGISYLVVSPHITKPSPRHEEFYKRLMADGHLSYELPVNLHTASRPWTQLEIWNGNQPLAKSELRIMASVAENMPNVDTPSLMLAMEQALKNSTPPTRSEVRETKSNGERTLTQPKSSISDDEKLSPAQEEEILRLGDQIKALKRQHLLHSVLYLATVPFALYFAYRGLRSLFSEFFNPTTLLLLIAYQLPITLPIFYGFFNLKLFKRLETTRTNKKNLEELRTYVPKDQNSRTLNDKKSSRSEVRGIQTLSDQGEKHAAIAEKLLGGHIQAVWGAAKTLGKTNTQGKTITLTPEVYRVIQPYLLPLPGHLSANGVAPEKIEEMERRENVDRKSKVIIDALFNLANIKDAEAEALLRKLFVPRSLLNDEAYTARIKFSIDKAMQGPMRNRIFNGFWHLREAAAMMIMDIEIYQRYEKLPSVSVSPIKKTFILAEFLCMRGVENWAETDMNSYQLRISSVLNAMTSLGIVARDGLGKFRVLEYASELYDRFAEDIANFLIKYPEDTVAILENVWHYPDIGLWYGVIDKLNQKGIRISKKLTDIDTALVVLSGASLIPISFNIPARPSRPYDIFYKITFGRLPPTSLVYRDSFPYGEDYPGPDHKALRWILAGMNNFLDDHPKNDLAAFLGVISKRKNENEITDQQLWDISEMLHNFAIKAYGLLSRYGPLHDQLKTVADVDQAKGLISGMLQQRNAFMLQGMAVKKRVVQYFYEEILKRNHLQPTWPSPLGLLEGMSDILNHYLWRCEYFFDRLEYEYALLNAKGDMTGTNNTHARSEVRSKISLLLAEAGVQKLSGKNQTEVAEIIDASQAGVSRYLDRHPEAYDTYKILRPVEKSDIEAGLAEAGVQKLSGKNQTEVAEIIDASQGGVSLYLDRHPEAYDTYKILRLVEKSNIEAGLAEAGVQKLSGKNQTEVAEIIGATPAGVSNYLDRHPEAYDTYKILRPVDIEAGLAEAGVQKLSGKNQTEVAEIIGATPAGVSNYLDRHPEAYDTYKILRPVDIEAGLAKAGVQKLSGKNHTEVAEIIDASQTGVSNYLDRHPEAYDTYKILRPVEKSDIETGLAEAGVQKLSGKNQTEVAEIIGATQGGVSLYLDRHPEAYDTYKILRLVEKSEIETGLAEAGVQKLSGKNQTEVAEIIDATQGGVSLYLDRHPEAYDTYKILRPVEKSDIETGLAEAGVQKLSGKNQTEVAEIIGATQGGVSHYLDRHPAAYSVYQIRKLESGFARSEVRDFTPGRVELVNQKNWDLRALVLDWENTIQKSAQFFYDFQIPLFCNMIYGAQPTNSEKKAVADHIKAHHDPLPDLFQWAMQERVLHGKLIKTPPSWGGFLKTYEATAEQALIKAQPSWQKETPLIPGIESLLKELRGKLGLFVATSVLEQLKRKQAQMTGLAGYFENIFGAESEKFPSGQYSKMAILRKLMAEKKLTGRQIGIVEDSLDVLLQAQKMGVVTIGIVENAEKAKQFRRARVDIIIHGDYRNRQDFRKAISSRSEMRSSESYDARLAKTENKYRLALRSAIAEKLGVSQNHISIKNDLKGDSNLFGNPKSLVIKQDSTPLAYLRYVVSETDPSTGGREKTIEAYSFTEDSDLLPHMIAYVAFVHDSKQLHVSEANDDQLSAMDKIERLGFGSGHTWSAYHHHDMDLNMGALRTLLFPSLKKITIDPMPNEIDLPVKIGGQVHLVKRTDTDLQWPNFAYDVYWNGKRVIPLAMEEFKSKKKDYVLPNVVGNLNSDQLNLNIDVIDLGPITGNGIGSAIIKFLAGIASTLNLELHGTSTSNPGIMRLWGSVTDFTFNDAWVKAMLKSQLKKELAKEPVFDSDHARPDKAYTSFYFTTDTKGHAKFVFGNGDMLRSAQAYYFNSKSFSGSLYAVSLVLERDAPQTVKVDSLRVRDSKDAKKWLPSDLMRSGASLEEFNFNQDGTIDFQGKPFGRLVAFEDQVDVIGSPIPTRSEMRAKTPDEKGEENASAKSWIIPGKSKSESFYLAWGIRKYSSLLRRLLGNQFATLKISDAEAVKRELRNSVINEVIHEIGSFYFGLLSLGLFFKTVITLGAPWRQTVFSFTLSVIVGIASFLNLYPVMHGRYNRKRIYRILNRRSSEKKAQEKGVAQATLASKPRSEVRKSATVEPSQSNIRAPKPERKPVSIKLAVLNGVRSWMDAIPPGKMYIAISAETLARLGDEKQGGRSEARLWKEFLILKKIYAEKLKVVITGDVASKAGGRVKELENFGGKVFTGSAGLHLPKDAQVIYLTFEDRDEESLPAQLQPKIRASFHNLQEGDFLSAVQLSLSSYLDQDLRALPNIRQFIADQLSFNAAHELETLFSSWVIISAAA